MGLQTCSGAQVRHEPASVAHRVLTLPILRRAASFGSSPIALQQALFNLSAFGKPGDRRSTLSLFHRDYFENAGKFCRAAVLEDIV
jgi:hypothetical protein